MGPGCVTVSNYSLRSLGLDGLLGTADDAIIPLTISISRVPSCHAFSPVGFTKGSTASLRVTLLLIPRQSADGDADGTSGGNWIRDFVVLGGRCSVPLPCYGR